MLKTLEEAIGKNDSEKQLEILDTVEEILADNIIISSDPELAQLFLSKLFMLIRSDEKQVREKRWIFIHHQQYNTEYILYSINIH